MKEIHDPRAGAARRMFHPVRAALFLIVPIGLACVAIHLMASARVESALTEGLIYMIIVIGLSIFVGNTGIVSFGHVSFAMIGAYASAWQTCCGPLRIVSCPIYRPGCSPPRYPGSWRSSCRPPSHPSWRSPPAWR